jgi:hypothetical protein
LPEIDGVVLANSLADLAFLLFEEQAAFVDIGDQRNRLGKVYMDRFVVGYSLIELVGIRDRTVLHASAATRALVLYDVSGLPGYSHLEIAHVAFYTVNFGVGQYLDIWMPADLDQFR